MMRNTPRFLSLFLLFCDWLGTVSTFSAVETMPRPCRTVALTTLEAFAGDGAAAGSADTSKLETLLEERYPIFMQLLLANNNDIWKELRYSNEGMTLFAPNQQAWAKVGEKRMAQLQDERNLETMEKIGTYHAIAEKVTAEELFNAGGVVTLGEEVVTIERTVTGGVFGVGGKEDGGVTLNNAKVVQTWEEPISDCIVHEVDALVSPDILWRFCDQLRIPGSK